MEKQKNVHSPCAKKMATEYKIWVIACFSILPEYWKGG